MAPQRYDVQTSANPEEWEERYGSPVNAPVLDADGRVVMLVHREVAAPTRGGAAAREAGRHPARRPVPGECGSPRVTRSPGGSTGWR